MGGGTKDTMKSSPPVLLSKIILLLLHFDDVTSCFSKCEKLDLISLNIKQVELIDKVDMVSLNTKARVLIRGHSTCYTPP